ncbi:rCG50948 [Rattus norvegicus]|uniref:RCG50948 n=1 Tax=Rattus norvegicus TaxID=10116 RepID=A6KGI7_RAT|nr:rCG50948 [Rattus norvegicus]
MRWEAILITSYQLSHPIAKVTGNAVFLLGSHMPSKHGNEKEGMLTEQGKLIWGLERWLGS